MSPAPPHPKTLKEIERTCVPGLVEVLRMEGVDGVRYALWDMTGWHRDYDPCVWRSRATEEQKRVDGCVEELADPDLGDLPSIVDVAERRYG